jgi:hypothetical protein
MKATRTRDSLKMQHSSQIENHCNRETMTKKMAEKQKTATIAKPQSQKKRLAIASTKAPLGKPVPSRAGLLPSTGGAT